MFSQNFEKIAVNPKRLVQLGKALTNKMKAGGSPGSAYAQFSKGTAMNASGGRSALNKARKETFQNAQKNFSKANPTTINYASKGHKVQAPTKPPPASGARKPTLPSNLVTAPGQAFPVRQVPYGAMK